MLSALAACASDTGDTGDAGTEAETATGPKLLVLGQDVWEGYQAYLTKMDRTQRGAFAITEDGTSAFADRQCAAATCSDTAQIQAEAIAACEESGDDCVIFALDRASQIPYRTPQ
nr:hypothetical protein [uncultured Dongia sp.]